MDNQLPVTILLVEDYPGHALLIEKNLRRARIANNIITLDNGQKAVDFLFKEGDFREDTHPAPLLILLDLNLPVLDGYQVLKIIKSDMRTRQIPVVVLTTTDTPHDIVRCYELDAMSTFQSRLTRQNFPRRSGTSDCSSRSSRSPISEGMPHCRRFYQNRRSYPRALNRALITMR